MKLNVLDFATPEEAFSRCRDGDRIHFPGRYEFQYFAPVAGYKIKKSIEVFGDGMCDNGIQTGSVIFGHQTGSEPNATFDDVFVIDFTAANVIGPVYFHDFKIPKTKNGIRCDLSTGKSVQSIVAERVNVFNASEAGFRLLGFDAGAKIESVAILASTASFCLERGVWLKQVRAARVERSTFIDNHLHGIDAEGCAIALYNTGCDNTQHLGLNPPPVAYKIEEQMIFSSCTAVLVDACAFESFQPISTAPAGAGVGCRFVGTKAAQIGGTSFYTGGSSPTSPPITAILADGAGSGPVVVLPNRYERVAGWMVNVADDMLDCVVLAQFDRMNQLTHKGAIHVPAAIGGNGGCVGDAFERRPSDEDTRRGMVFPSGTVSTTDTRDGMLYLSVSSGKLMGRVGAQWKTVLTD